MAFFTGPSPSLVRRPGGPSVLFAPSQMMEDNKTGGFGPLVLLSKTYNQACTESVQIWNDHHSQSPTYLTSPMFLSCCLRNITIFKFI